MVMEHYLCISSVFMTQMTNPMSLDVDLLVWQFELSYGCCLNFVSLDWKRDVDFVSFAMYAVEHPFGGQNLL